MTISEEDILAFVVDLPIFPQISIGRATNAVLCVIILIAVIRVKDFSSHSITGEHEERRILDMLGVYRAKFICDDIFRSRTVKIIKE